MKNVGIASSIAGRMMCASGLAYSIPLTPSVLPAPGVSLPMTAPFYLGAGYTTLPEMIQCGDGACTLGINQDGIVLAFEGTVFSDGSQWLNDLLALMKPLPGVSGNQGKVHDGFCDDVEGVIDAITTSLQSLINESPKLPIIITGHSKGAAMAPIAAFLLHARGITASSLYLFAPPLPGDATFASNFNTAFPETFSFQSDGDIVPLLPPSPTWCFKLAEYAPSHVIRDAIVASGLLGYAPVGIAPNVQFINAPTGGVYPAPEPMTPALAKPQLEAAGVLLKASNWTALGAAHSHECGAAYMSSICPEVACPG